MEHPAWNPDGSGATYVRKDDGHFMRFSPAGENVSGAALGKQPFSADATTVGGLRTTTIGTRAPSQATMYPEFSDSAFAAWCWFGHGTYDVYEVTSDGTPHQVVSDYTVPASEAHGAPAIP